MKKFIFFSLLIFHFSLVNAQNWLWGKQGTNRSGVSVLNVACDNKGNAFQTGCFVDSISFGAYTLHAKGEDVFLVKYDSIGNVLWARQSTVPATSNYAIGTSVCTDNLGNSYITGYFFGDNYIPFGADTLYSYVWNVFLVKYDVTGNVLWAKQSADPGLPSGGNGYSVTTDALGNVYVTGGFHDTISFGAYTLYSTEYYNVFLVKYAPNGNLLWAKQSTNGTGTAYSVTTDVSGNAYITGYFGGTLSFGAYKLQSNGVNVFLVKYDINGNIMWAKQSNGINGTGYSVTTDVSGNAYITGYFGDTISFDNDTLFSQSYWVYSAFLVKYDSIGNMLWAKQSYRNYSTWGLKAAGYSLASDKFGHIFLSGSLMDSSIIFCNDTLCAPQIANPSMVMELDTAGNVLCSSVITTSGYSQNGIACDPTGKYVYFGGVIEDIIAFGKDILLPFSSLPPFVARWQPCVISSIIDTTKVVTNEPCTSVFVPNAFSPNADGQNDILYVRGPCIKGIDFIIYDRWGNKVFESDNINDGWDGTYKGQPMNTGTYVYYLTANMYDGSVVKKKGNVALVR